LFVYTIKTMPRERTTVTQRILQILAVFAIAGVSIAGIRLLAAGPCDIPVTWSVGRVDSQFGLSEQMVAQYGKEATDIWNAAHPEKTLFAYRENGGELTLTFEYDERMQTTIRNQRLKRSITTGQDKLSDIKQTTESLRAEYAALEESIASLTKIYNGRLNTYNREVSYWNSQGGAPKDTYARLQRDESDLEDERMSLNEKINYYNQLGERIRDYGKDHNEIVSSLNAKINVLNETALREFEEGIYNPNDNSITVYEYASPTALKRVLIHEFGHALSLGHVEGENSVMYPVNLGRTLELSTEDLAALRSVCEKKPLSGFLQLPVQAFGVIRDGISRLAGSSSPDTAAQSE
jgi:hypothetical protein